jgi:hypothetical protein
MAFRISAASSSDRRAYGALKTRFRRLDSRLLNPAGQPCQSFATQHPDEILTDPRARMATTIVACSSKSTRASWLFRRGEQIVADTELEKEIVNFGEQHGRNVRF